MPWTLWTAGPAWSCCAPASGIEPLRVSHMFDGSVLSPGWEPEEFLPQEVRDLMHDPSGWDMELSLNEAGDLSALFGVTTGGCGDSSPKQI